MAHISTSILDKQFHALPSRQVHPICVAKRMHELQARSQNITNCAMPPSPESFAWATQFILLYSTGFKGTCLSSRKDYPTSPRLGQTWVFHFPRKVHLQYHLLTFATSPISQTPVSGTVWHDHGHSHGISCRVHYPNQGKQGWHSSLCSTCIWDGRSQWIAKLWSWPWSTVRNFVY